MNVQTAVEVVINCVMILMVAMSVAVMRAIN